MVDPYIHFWQNKVQTKNSNIVICTSPKYVDYYKNLNINKVITIPHGISEEEQKIDVNKVNQILNDYGKFAILIGSIDNDINLDLLKKIALKNIKIIIIGSEFKNNFEWEKLKQTNNIFYLGIMHAKELKNYISAAKVCLIAYNFSPKKNQISRSPLKALNYLAQKKPIVSSIDTEIDILENEGIYKASNENEFFNFVNDGINNQLEINQQKIDDYLKKHKYELLINNILIELNDN